MSDWKDTLAALSAPFGVAEVKQRQGGGKMLDYIDWTAVVRRLNDVCPNWSMDSSVHSIHPAGERNGKPLFAVVCEVEIRIPDPEHGYVHRCGVGAGVSDDIDMAAKTAQAEALKKASNQFGMALELWDAEHRDTLKAVRDALKKNDIKPIKVYLAQQIPGIDTAEDKAVAFRKFYNLPDDANLDDFDTIAGLIDG